MTEETTINNNWISGFWRRIGAFIVDSVIIGLIGYMLGLFLSSWFVEIGVWGRLFGFIIALVYFGTLNSKVFNGQTLGKKLLKIKVVDLNNDTIGIFKSFTRYSILGIPFFLNGAKFSDEILFSPLIYILSFLVFGGLFGIIYLYIFNRKSRQSLHDVIMGTYVVNVNSNNVVLPRVWKVHIAVTAIFFIIAGLVPVYTLSLAKENSFQDLLETRNYIMKNHDISSVEIMYGSRSFYSNKEKQESTFVLAQVFLLKSELLNKELAHEIAKKITKNYPETMKKDILQIVLIYGYDIGISKQWTSQMYQFKPTELKDKK